MYLRSLTLTGFKSFPDRTRLEFGPGVSVVVGPNGSGKSNITDAILWALGEQSPLAVRGQAMQDVIFGGGPGVKARTAAEVELVLDNQDGAAPVGFSEVSVLRRLDRSGEGEYRMNGARCRLVDVLEALSDTGLGKEAHSVVSQGRVESIVTSKPRDRRMLIEEAAGLAKHRKRRRRAQLKLERTKLNIERALDIEREARSRLRPLERQARAAELHERLQRQMLEVRLDLVRDAAIAARAAHEAAQEGARGARAQRSCAEAELEVVMRERSDAERALAERAARNERVASRLYAARSAADRLAVRAEQTHTLGDGAAERVRLAEAELAHLERSTDGDAADAARDVALDRVRDLQAELAAADAAFEEELKGHGRELAERRAHAAELRRRLDRELGEARESAARARSEIERTRADAGWPASWAEVRTVIANGIERVLAIADGAARAAAIEELLADTERATRAAMDRELGTVEGAEQQTAAAQLAVSELERRIAAVEEEERRAAWMAEQSVGAAEHGPLALRRAQLRGELEAERRLAERLERERTERAQRTERLRTQMRTDRELIPLARRLQSALTAAEEVVQGRVRQLDSELASESAGGENVAAELRSCAQREAEIQERLRGAGEAVTAAEVVAERARERAAETDGELREIAAGLELTLDDNAEQAAERLAESEQEALHARLERLRRRREQLGPVNPLAGEELAQARAHVDEVAAQREDLESALRELRTLIRDTDRRISETFDETFAAVAEGFASVIGEVFPGGTGRLRLVDEAPHDDGDGEAVAQDGDGDGAPQDAAGTAPAGEDADEDALGRLDGERHAGVEIEVTPAGKSAKRLSLLSGGEKSMTALAFLFAVFLAKPCPFYVLDEVEAALDDLNLERFLALLQRCAGGAQFIVMTHQKRTMEAADALYGVSMGRDGVSKVASRRMAAGDAARPVPRLAQPAFASRAVSSRDEGARETDDGDEPWPRPGIVALGG
ncbi:MAG: chromosome segregation SMC family protein [Solirubrobacteraceae bacterium]